MPNESNYILNEKQVKNETELTLHESFKGGRILTGIVAGVEVMPNDNLTCAIVYMEPYKIIIPFDQFMDETPVPGRDPADWKRYLLSKRLGSEVDFVIRGIDEKGEFAIGDRKKAMSRIRNYEGFGAKKPNGEPLISVGNIVPKVRIISSVRSGILVDIKGTEVYIPASELSYSRIQDATVSYPVGSYIDVKITDISQDDEGKPVYKASVKATMANPYEKAMKRFQQGDTYVGQVTTVSKAGVFVKLPGGVDALCGFPDRGVSPVSGSMVTVRITNMQAEQNRIYGKIIHVSAAR